MIKRHVCKWSLLLIFILLLWSFYSAAGEVWGDRTEWQKIISTIKTRLLIFPPVLFLVIFSGKHNNVTRSATNNLICCKIFQICQICFRHSSWLWRSTCLLNPKLKAKSATTKHFNTSLENKANATRHKKQTLQCNT